MTIDLNAEYQSFIRGLFPNAKIVVDRFHLVQLAGRALDQIRIQVLHRMPNHRQREYRILKHNWRLFLSSTRRSHR